MWTVLTLGRLFTAPVVARKDEIVAGMIRMDPPSSERELERLDFDYTELKQFTSRLAALVRDGVDPTADLSSAYERGLGTLIPNYMVLSVGRWQAYFRIDHVAQVLLGVLIIRTDSGLPENMRTILDNIDGL